MPATERFPRDAERHLLAAAFVDPDWLANARELIKPEHFCEPAHGAVWQAIVSSTKAGEVTDEITLTAALRSSGDLPRVGGNPGVAELGSMLIGPTPAVHRWQQAVLDAHRVRALRDSLERILRQADSGTFTAEEIHKAAATAVESTSAGATAATRPPQRFLAKDLVAFDRTADPDCIFGMRYLGRGQSAMFIAGTGVGKSSFINGAACHWALGRDYFGFRPKDGRALRTLIVQSENCLGDTAEAYQDSLAGMGIPLDSQLADDIGDRVAFYRESVRTGEAFGKVLRDLILSHRADVTVIDPMLGFAGIDVSKQDQLSHWLRGILQPILLETGTCLLTIHHTNKPRPASESALVNFDNLAYLGAGGADLANWHRATLALLKDPTPEGEEEKPHYSLIAAKRGGRAGLKDDQGNFTRIVRIRHSKTPGVIRWERRTDLPLSPDAPAIERKGVATASERRWGSHP